jgi:hypothetical protein
MSSHLAAQRAVVRMLFDPAFAEAARHDPDRVLAGVDPALRRQLAQLDDRALRQDGLRRRRTLRILSEELKASTTLFLSQKRKLAALDDFFCSAAFHSAVEERGSLCLALAAFLAEEAGPELRAVLAIESALARARRDAHARPPGVVSTAPGVVPISTVRGAMAALQACERYLFEVGLMPAVALCDDAPPLALPPWDATPLELVTVPLDSGVTLVEIDAPLAQLLRCLPAARARVLEEAAARGVADAAARLDELIADEIVVT